MPKTIPDHVPHHYRNDNAVHGHNGVVEALRHANEADRLVASYEHKLDRSRNEDAQERYRERVDYYKKQSIKWRACALNTSLEARRRLNQDERDRLKLIRDSRELVCSPASIQDAMKRAS